MSGPRTSMRALRTLSKPTVLSTPQARTLHMTGQATSPSPAMTRDTTSNRHPIPAQQRKKSLEDSLLSSESNPVPARHFNTSRELKAVRDSSTIDFAYLPDIDPDADEGQSMLQVRIPILPDTFMPSSTKTGYTPEEEEIVMRPEISLAAASGTHVSPPSAFAEVHDNSAVDFQGVVQRAAAGVADAAAQAGQDAGTVRRVWNGFVDDLFGERKGSS